MIHPNERERPLIILGSSRGDGNTLEAVRHVFPDNNIPLVDLGSLAITYYDYQAKNSNDDFIPLAERMVQHNPIILATPVYWYTMSATMKTFIDRWSDLISIRKDLGRKLKGKDLYVIASYGTDIPKGFEDAFAQTCDYMDMNYRACFFHYSGQDSALKKMNRCNAEAFAGRFLTT